jgi:type II secretory pathway component PulF
MEKRLKTSILYIRNKLWYIIAIAIMAFLSGGMLLYEFYAPNPSKNIIEVFQHLDLTIAYIFLIDFLAGMYAAPEKNLVYLRKNWLDLLGSIPVHDSFFRAMRIFRFTRLVRITRAANIGINIRDSVKRASGQYNGYKNHRKKKG